MLPASQQTVDWIDRNAPTLITLGSPAYFNIDLHLTSFMKNIYLKMACDHYECSQDVLNKYLGILVFKENLFWWLIKSDWKSAENSAEKLH